MEARSFTKKLQENLQTTRLVQYEAFSSNSASPPLPTSPLPYYTPIFLSPSSLGMIPSPSPLPAAAGSSHPVPTAAIVGGSVAGVVAIAATVAVVSTVAGNAGLSCLLLPICKLLSCLGESLSGSACAERLKSLWNILDKRRKRRRSNEAADEEEGRADSDEGDILYEILTGGSPARSSKAEESTTVVAAYSSTASPLRHVAKGQQVEQLQTAAHAYLVTTVSDFADSELKQAEGIMMQPLHQKMTKAQAYAEPFLSVADEVIGNANRVKASEEAIAAIWRQPGDTALSMSSKVVEDVGRGNVKTSKSQAVASGKLQGSAVGLEEEGGLYRKRRKPPAITSTSVGAADKSSEGVVLNDGSKGSGQVCIVESASDAFTELQVVVEQTAGGVAASHKQKLRKGAASHDTDDSMALVPADTGGTLTNKASSRTMIPMPAKTLVQDKTTTLATKGKQGRDDVTKAMKGKRKRQTSLGHVSISCELSVHRLRFFTSCKSGGTYGSPPASPHHNFTSSSNSNHHHHDNYYHDNNNVQATSNTYLGSSGQSSSAHYQLYVPLYNASHYSHMHQPLYHPSQSILVKHNNNNAAPPSTHHFGAVSHALVGIGNMESPLEGPPNPSIDDYGGPFDGVL